MLSCNELYHVLGLENPAGRTTKTYVDLISHLSMYPTSKVYYMSPCIQTCNAQLNNIKTLIDKVNKIKNINLDYRNIVPITNKDQLEGIDPSKVFYDHYCFEYVNV